MRCEAKAAISAVTNSAGTKPRPRTVSPNSTGAGRMNSMPRQAIATDRLALETDRLHQHDQRQQDQDPRQHQRKIAGPHAQRRADLEPERLQHEENAEGPEERGAERVGGVDGDGFHDFYKSSDIFGEPWNSTGGYLLPEAGLGSQAQGQNCPGADFHDPRTAVRGASAGRSPCAGCRWQFPAEVTVPDPISDHLNPRTALRRR